MRDLIRRIRQRKIVQWLLVYMTGAWAVSEVIDTLVVTFLGMDSLRGTMLVVAALGIPVVAVLAWYHGEKGRQRVSGPELAILATLFLVLGSILALVSGRSANPSPGAGGTDIEPAPAIAVMPSIPAGTDADVIGDGIVSVLSTGLDAVPGWRAVSPRTVLARWTERVPDGMTADEATSLAIARATGARYAVLPTTAVLGTTVRVTADVYDLMGPAGALRSVERSGSPDALVTLADGLAVEILGAVLEGSGEIPQIDLSRTTSDSPEALREFLRGEVFYRDFQLEDARDAFDRALAFDSSFARVHYRLIEVHSWGSTLDLERVRQHTALALKNIDRLSEREALVVRGLTASDGNESLRLLREAVARYPDDATAWNWLGEQMIHGFSALASAEEIDSVFRRAIALDPGRAGLYPHPVGLLFAELADSAGAAALVPVFARAASGVAGTPIVDDIDPRGGPLAFDYAFGDSAHREAARARILNEYEAGKIEGRTSVAMLLGHPRHWEGVILPALELDRRLGPAWLERSTDAPSRRLTAGFEGLTLWRGKVREGVAWLDSMDTGNARSVHDAAIMGIPIPSEVLLAEFGPARISSDSTFRVFRATVLAAQEDRWSDFDRGRSLLDARAPDDPAVEARGFRQAADAWAEFRRGDAARAVQLLEPLIANAGTENRLMVWMLGEAYMALGQWTDAERVFRTGSLDHYYRHLSVLPLARYRLGQALEAQDRSTEAAEAYAYFAEHWANADPELQPLVQDALEAIARLSPDHR